MTTNCNQCKVSVLSENAFECKLCNKKGDDDENDDDDDDDVNKDKTPLFYCKRCKAFCFICDIKGCEGCVKTVCGDCSVSMCKDCRNGDNLCGCYGRCFGCNRQVNRGSHGWPCNECNKWGCWDCRRGENNCKECNPNYESDKDESDEEEETSILMAARLSDESKTQKLLANVNEKDCIGQTPLIIAAQHGNLNVVKVLLSTVNVDIAHRNEYGENAAIMAAQEGHFEVLKILVEAGVDIVEPNANGETALQLAIQLRAGKEVVEFLETTFNIQKYAKPTLH